MRMARLTLSLAPAVLVAVGLTAGALHDTGCVYTYANPTTGTFIPYVHEAMDVYGFDGGEGLYLEERGNPFGVPVPLTSWLFGADDNGDGVPEFLEGEGSFIYEETGELPNLQRGGFTGMGDWFPPGCDQSWWDEFDPQNPDLPSGNGPCLFIDEDPINDESCGHSSDDIVWSFGS